MNSISKDVAAKIALMVWVPLIVTFISIQMVNHFVAMPVPEDYRLIEKNIPKLRQTDKWMLVHVIYKECSCTNSLVQSLISRGASKQQEEWVLYVGAEGSARDEIKSEFVRAGYSFRLLSREVLSVEYGVEAAPLLLIFSADNKLKYGGGYFERPSVYRSKDQEIIKNLLSGNPVEALPLYGCAVSDRLQNAIDPLGMKIR